MQVSDLKSQYLQVRSKIWPLLEERRSGNRNRNKFFKSGVADLNALGLDVDNEIFRLENKSRDLLFRISEGSGFRELDLHHLTLDEAVTMVDKVLDHLEDLMEQQNCNR